MEWVDAIAYGIKPGGKIRGPPVSPFKTWITFKLYLMSFKDLANPQKIKTAVALNCIACWLKVDELGTLVGQRNYQTVLIQ